MPNPGDTGGGCPRCDVPTVMVGYGSSVLGVYCEDCKLLVALDGEAGRLGDIEEADADV